MKEAHHTLNKGVHGHYVMSANYLPNPQTHFVREDLELSLATQPTMNIPLKLRFGKAKSKEVHRYRNNSDTSFTS